MRRLHMSVAALSAASLLFESTLTRLLAVAQYYHFAFLVVSLALLGFGASGTLLSIFPKLRLIPTEKLLFGSGMGFAAGVCLAYGGVNWLPFDSYSIAWERRQILFFFLYYLALTIPFLVSGLGIGGALALAEKNSHLIYAANLLGSALGVLLAPLSLAWAGVPGAVLISALMGILSGLFSSGKEEKYFKWGRRGLFLLFGLGLLVFGSLGLTNLGGQSSLGMEISQYKGLSYARQVPGSRSVYGYWNAISRVDVFENAGTRSLPGLSYQFPGIPPVQLGLSIDANALQPITLASPEDFNAAGWLPETLAFTLKPGANVLVIEPGGGLGVLQSLAGGAEKVTVVLENPAIHRAVAHSAEPFDIYTYPGVRTVSEPERVYLHRDEEAYDIIYYPLTDPYWPVTSGAYSLAEEYSLTVESFEDAYKRLNPGGILLVSRWLQSPPSESLRLIFVLVEALQAVGETSPAEAILAYRGIQTMTVLVKPDGWSPDSLILADQFLESRRFDWVWASGLDVEEINRFNKLPEPVYYQGASKLLTSPSRAGFVEAYPYNINPPVDNQPFFFHFFTWAQTSTIVKTIGKTWQPFGGSGYLLMFALLGLVIILSVGLILLPLVFRNRISNKNKLDRRTDVDIPVLRRVFLYFALLGFAFLFVEIPLIQRWILLLGQPIYAFTAVVGFLLLFSGVGSAIAQVNWLPKRFFFGLLVFWVLGLVMVIPWLVEWILGWALWARLGMAFLTLAPLGVLMGLPFPLGLVWLEDQTPHWIPWAWAINGCASVVASVLAAIFSLSFGFSWVMLLGVGAYAGAWITLNWGKIRHLPG